MFYLNRVKITIKCDYPRSIMHICGGQWILRFLLVRETATLKKSSTVFSPSSFCDALLNTVQWSPGMMEPMGNVAEWSWIKLWSKINLFYFPKELLFIALIVIKRYSHLCSCHVFLGYRTTASLGTVTVASTYCREVARMNSHRLWQYA